MNIETEELKGELALLISEAEKKSAKPGHEKYYRNRAACFKEVLDIIGRIESEPEEDCVAAALDCRSCGYCWQETCEAFPHCHWVPRCPGDVAPCDEPVSYAEDGCGEESPVEWNGETDGYASVIEL